MNMDDEDEAGVDGGIAGSREEKAADFVRASADLHQAEARLKSLRAEWEPLEAEIARGRGTMGSMFLMRTRQANPSEADAALNGFAIRIARAVLRQREIEPDLRAAKAAVEEAEAAAAATMDVLIDDIKFGGGQ